MKIPEFYDWADQFHFQTVSDRADNLWAEWREDCESPTIAQLGADSKNHIRGLLEGLRLPRFPSHRAGRFQLLDDLQPEGWEDQLTEAVAEPYQKDIDDLPTLHALLDSIRNRIVLLLNPCLSQLNGLRAASIVWCIRHMEIGGVSWPKGIEILRSGWGTIISSSSYGTALAKLREVPYDSNDLVSELQIWAMEEYLRKFYQRLSNTQVLDLHLVYSQLQLAEDVIVDRHLERFGSGEAAEDRITIQLLRTPEGTYRYVAARKLYPQLKWEELYDLLCVSWDRLGIPDERRPLKTHDTLQKGYRRWMKKERDRAKSERDSV